MKQPSDHRGDAHSTTLEGALEAGAAVRRDVAIAGVGLVAPLGDCAGACWEALLEGKHIEDHARGAGEYDRTIPRIIQMAKRAAGEAMAEANWAGDENDAIVVGTSKGSIVHWLGSADRRFDSAQTCGPGPAALGDVAASLAGRGQARLTVSAACASGLMALIRGAMMIRSGEAVRVLVAAAEASVHPLFLGSFKRLGLLADPHIGCRPFDECRDGFLMSEAAAAVCLEASDPAQSMDGALFGKEAAGGDSRRSIIIDRYAMGADAAHLTASDPSGALLKRLIRQVRAGRPMDLIHAHGTATPANDPIELAAIEAEMDQAAPPANLYSHKGALGHSLGASGLLAVAINVLSHRHGVVPPNGRTTRPLAMRTVRLSQSSVERPIQRSMVLAAGFGGSTAAVSLVTR